MEYKARTYECTECGTQQDIKTNHEMECYPRCVGKCKQYFTTEKVENVWPKNTPHKYIKDAL